MRSALTAAKSSPRSLQLEKACTQQRRPNAAKKIFLIKKITREANLLGLYKLQGWSLLGASWWLALGDCLPLCTDSTWRRPRGWAEAPLPWVSPLQPFAKGREESWNVSLVYHNFQITGSTWLRSFQIEMLSSAKANIPCCKLLEA